MLKTKEREVECLRRDLAEKDDLLDKYSCEIDDLKADLQNKCSKYRELLKKVKSIRGEGSKSGEDNYEEDSCEDDSTDFDELLHAIVKSVEEQKKSIFHQFQNFECQIKALTAEKKIFLKERADFVGQLQRLKLENDQLTKDLSAQKKSNSEKEELIKAVDALKSEKNELLEKVNTLHDKIQELNKNFKETRWALTAEVAEKHDQVQELKRCVGTLEDQLRQADMQTHFKDDIIKELRKELKASKKSLSTLDGLSKMPSRDNSPKLSVPQKKSKDDELKVDIHIFPINEGKPLQPDQLENDKFFRSHSVEVQTELSQSLSASNIRNVATQHKTRVQKLPRSFGTLTVTPWSGAAGELNSDEGSPECLREAKKNLKGIYTVPFSDI